MTRHWRVILTGLLASTLALSGCGTDDVGPRGRMVGGRCTTNQDCVQTCVTGGAFPGGYCTVGCARDSDCPGGSACVARNGGICLATCRTQVDCAAYGAEYQCTRQTNQSGSGGEPLTCLAD